MNNQQPTIEQPTNKPPTSATRPTQPQRIWGWTALLWLLLSLWLVLLLPFLEALPWSTQLAPWILPATIAAGSLLYLCSQIIARRDRRSRTMPTLVMGEGAGDDVSSFPALPLLLLVALLAGAALSLHNATVAQLEAGSILLGA